MMSVGLAHYLTVAAVLFTIGVFGIFVNRRNVIVILMAIELILLAVNINLVAFSAFLHDVTGQIFAMFVARKASRRRLDTAGGETLCAASRAGAPTPVRSGAVAQLVERVVRNDEVRGSTPLGSTRSSLEVYGLSHGGRWRLRSLG